MPRPRWSLVGRVTALAAFLGVLSLAAQGLVLHFWMQPLADDAVLASAGQVRLVLNAMVSVRRDEREAMASHLSSDHVQISLQKPPDTPPADVGLSGFVERLQEQLGSEAQVLPAEGGEGGPPQTMIFLLPLDGQNWWMTLHGKPPARVVLRDTAVLWLLLLAAATLGGLVFGVRLIAQPISRMARAIAAQHGTLRPLEHDARASEELQTLTRAFNELAHAVELSNAAKQQLLAGVSHDLRTPLARLRLRAETQCEPELADALITDLYALERIVAQFLAYVQGDAGMRLGTTRPLDETVRQLVRQYAGASQTVSVVADAVEHQAPDLAIQRLLTNLIDNALAHGGSPVQVELTQRGSQAVLTVYDHGPGMTDEQFVRAQEPFVRLRQSPNEIGHCGLGLAIVAQIVRQLGAQLSLAPASNGRPFGISVSIPR